MDQNLNPGFSATHPSRGLLAIKAAMLCTVLKEFAIGLVGRPEDEHPGVEAIGPSGIWSR